MENVNLGSGKSFQYKRSLTREELIKKYNLTEDDQVYLLDIFEKIELELFRFLSFHV